MNEIIQLSNGNPGAMVFLMGMISGDVQNSIAGITILPKIKSCGIKGTDLYVLWSDLCNKDYQLTAKLCRDCPDNILIDACSRQDYSGRELVKEYLN